MRALSLHHLIAFDLTADALVESAAELGCPHVCLISNIPTDAIKGVPDIRDEDVARLRRHLDDAQIVPYGVSSFPILPDTDLERYEAGLKRGAGLGASRANARILDGDEGRAARTFADFGERCVRSGLLPCIEFTGFREPDALPRALRIIAAAGCGAISLDMIHIVNTETPWQVLKDLDRSLIGYVQLCDGVLSPTREDYEDQQLYDRQPPGDGEFPLAQLMSIVSPEHVLSLEIPCRTLRGQGFEGRTLVAEVVRRTRAHLTSLGLE